MRVSKTLQEGNKITITPENSVFSGYLLMIIPIDPKFSPNDHQIRESLQFLQNEYPGMILESEKLGQVEFVACGQNFVSVTCNLCGEELEIEFWQEQMSNSYEESNFNELEFVTDCCKKKTSLNDLIYYGDCGFSSYYLSINNAEPDEEKELLVAKRMGELLGTAVKVFWSHT